MRLDRSDIYQSQSNFAGSQLRAGAKGGHEGPGPPTSDEYFFAEA